MLSRSAFNMLKQLPKGLKAICFNPRSNLSSMAMAQAQPNAPLGRAQPFINLNEISAEIFDGIPLKSEHEDPPIITPQFSHEGQFVIAPEKYTINCDKFTQTELNPQNQSLCDEMRAKFNDIGLVYLTGTGLTQLQAMRELVTVLIPPQQSMEYKGGSNWRNWIEPNVYDTGAPKEAWVHYHHEMAYVKMSPESIAFCAKSVLPNGRGATYVSDQVQATEELLTTEFGQKLKDKGICYVRCLTDEEYYRNARKSELEVYNHWQKSFGTDDPELAVEMAHERGLVTEWENHERHGRYLRTKFFIDVYEYFPLLDKNLLFASVADHWMWFDTWPGLSMLPNRERPLEITYGDGTKMSHEELRQFVDIYDKYGVKIEWNVGDIAIMCNYRWAHGRPIYQQYENESRDLGVILGPTFERMGQREDKW